MPECWPASRSQHLWSQQVKVRVTRRWNNEETISRGKNGEHIVTIDSVTSFHPVYTPNLAESNGSLLPGLWRDSLHVTCGLTACIPGSAPGPTLGNEYGKTLLYTPISLFVASKPCGISLRLPIKRRWIQPRPWKGSLGQKAVFGFTRKVDALVGRAIA